MALSELDDGPIVRSIEGADDAVSAIGARIRRLRLERNLTLQMMSERTGLSASMLSMVERGRTSPSIGSLVAVASALEVRMTEFFDGWADESISPVRRADVQPTVETSAGVLRRVAHNDRHRGVEVSVNEYGPGTTSSSVPTHHEGTEYGLVIDGILTVEVGGVAHVLGPGDAIWYQSSDPHRISNPGTSRTTTVWINLSR
ncbi:MAG: cupin domain-containing protein [Actinomycetota bacterium]|nr:cupin domain-containing protein [Actinomycetota bacterium]